jgi:hypothetical protein
MDKGLIMMIWRQPRATLRQPLSYFVQAKKAPGVSVSESLRGADSFSKDLFA